MITRFEENQIKEKLFKGKAIIIQGARQVGKTTLLHSLEKEIGVESLWLDCDEIDIRNRLTGVSSVQLRRLIGNNKLVFIDEAQRVEEIGLTLKLITDNLKNVQLVVSGSSALELSGKINEALTGRKYEFTLYPISSAEMCNHTSEIEETRLLENRLLYGLYPDVVNNAGEEQRILKELVNSYLYKDLLIFKEIRKPHIIPKLLLAIALQLGNEVSNNELSKLIGADRETIERYLDLLEKMYIIFRLGSFNRNLRTELNKSKKIYFFDLGIRNALISNFNPLSLRTDTGPLWENYLIVERLKLLSSLPYITSTYFWRTHLQQEIDYIEDSNGILHTYEFKWNKNIKARLPKTFSNAYKEHSFSVINRENYLEFIKPDK